MGLRWRAMKGPTMIRTNEAIKRIRAALKKKTGKTWSVTHGRGTSSCWITVQAPPRRRVNHDPIGDINAPGWYDQPYRERVREVAPPQGKRGMYTSFRECDQIARAFALDYVPDQGLLISPDETELYVTRAETKGRTVAVKRDKYHAHKFSPKQPPPVTPEAPIAITFEPETDKSLASWGISQHGGKYALCRSRFEFVDQETVRVLVPVCFGPLPMLVRLQLALAHQQTLS